MLVQLLESTPSSAAQLLLPQSQHGHLVDLHLHISIVLKRISRPSCDPLYATNTSYPKRETFLYKYPLQEVILPPTQKKKRTKARYSS
jgi:hypothetical protein